MGQSNEVKKVLVVGASRGTGKAAVEELLEAGYAVTAFSRRASALEIESDRLRKVDGDATSYEDVDEAVRGHDAVIVTLGIAENPLGVRLFGGGKTPLDVRSVGTRNVVEAMERHGVGRLVVQSTFGVGESAGLLGTMDRLFFALLLKPQIEDTVRQEAIVRGSALDWVLAQPVHLTDGDDGVEAKASVRGETGRMKVARRQVARVLVRATRAPEFVGHSVAISGGGA